MPGPLRACAVGMIIIVWCNSLPGGPGKAEESSSAESREEPATAQATKQAATACYRRFCSTCHGDDGKGADMRPYFPAIPDFTSPAFQERITDNQMSAAVSIGKGTKMPAFGRRLTIEEMRGLIDRVRAFSSGFARRSKSLANDYSRDFQELQERWQELRRQFYLLGERAEN
jgi:mono/diheme cytochrome c family protein